MKKMNWNQAFRCRAIAVVAASAMAFSPAQAAATGSNASSPETVVQNEGTVKVTGNVKDNAGVSIMGAGVQVKGSGQGVITDANGNFNITVKQGSVLVISYLGYTTQEVVAKGGNISIVLQEDNSMLDEVVVMGYGAATRKQDLSASVGVVSDPGKLAVRPVTSTEAMMQGQLPGVTITSNGGDPTSTPSVVIRGQGSANGDNVLWVVDGVPGAPIPSMYDIESIVVLKDAASAAIYGAQSGAGGCILVTTKQAQAGKTSLTYEGTVGARSAYNLPHGLTAQEQIKVRTQSHANAGLSLADGWDTTKNPWIATNRTDWVDEVFRTAFYQRHNVVINTGTETAKSRLSYAYDGDNGVLRNTYKKSHTLHYNGQFDINKWVTISEDFTWRNTSSRSTNTTSPENGVLMNAIHMPSSATVYNYDGSSYGGTTTEDPAYVAQYGSNYADIHGDAINPVRLLCADNNYDKYTTAWSTTTLQIHDIVPGLKFTSRFSYNINNYYYKNFSPMRTEIGKADRSNALDEEAYRDAQWKTENTLTYDNTFGKHTVGALLSTTADRYYSRGFSANGKTFDDEAEAMQYLAYAGSTSVTDWLSGPDANVSLVARGAYSYDDRYFLTASWRRDYAGRLPKGNNHGDFPAVTAGWKISNEKFFPKSKDINLLKLRASWGRVGNLGSISMNYKSAVLGLDVNTQAAQYGIANGQTWGSMIYYYQALNNDLTWETSEQWDLGIDGAFFENRLTVGLDYFNKRTYNLIQEQSIDWPSTIGIDGSNRLVNLGEVRNWGIEASVGWSDRIGKDWSYYVNANFAYLHNELTDIGTTTEDADGNTVPGEWINGNYNFKELKNVVRSTEGQPLNSFYLIKTDGIFKTDAEAAAYVDKDGNRIQPNAVAGDLKFVDANGDGKIDDNDRQYCGSATPKTTFALNLGFTWKNLSFSAMLQGVGGAKAMFVGKELVLDESNGNFNRWNKILDAWSTSNTSSDIPRLSANDANGNFSTASDYYLEDASYLRLKNVTIGYDLTDQLRKLGHFGSRMSSLYVYVSGENLFTITDYSGMDPECGGWDTFKYPVSRVFSFGVKLTY